jgi:glycine cleavage system H protein
VSVYYTEEHEWIAVDGDVGIVGITGFAAEKLGDIVFVDLPELGRKVTAGKDMAVVESVKAASDVYAPVSGEVTAVNAELSDAPEQVNADPEGEGWFVKLKLSDPGQLAKLMDKAAYDAFCAGQ